MWGGTNDAGAFQAYLKGLHFKNRGSVRETLFQARDAFQEAVEIDPQYARAWSGLALVWLELVWNSFVEFDAGREKINQAASQAVALAPDLAEGHMAMGLLWQLGHPQWQLVKYAYDSALARNPGSGMVLMEYARLHCYLGNQEESIAAARKALELDPISVITNHFLGHILYFTGNYEEAIPALRRTLELNSDFPKPHYFIAMALHWLGDSEAALAEIQHEKLYWMNLAASIVILHKLGRTEESMEKFDKLVELGVEETNYIQQADSHAQMGNADQAIECLQKAADDSDPGLAQLLVDPFLDPLREDPRFQELMTRMGFAPTAGIGD